MDNKAIYRLCKEQGCCDACCLRYLGIKTPNAYENSRKYSLNYHDDSNEGNGHSDTVTNTPDTNPVGNGETESINNDTYEPQSKRRKLDICESCLGILQEDTWPEQFQMVREVLEKKRYDCNTFACALSAPIATILREKAVILHIKEAFTEYDEDNVTSLKEAWKWSFASQLAPRLGLTLCSGTTSPLLVTLNYEYPDEMQELEVLKTLSPSLFESRKHQRRRFTAEFTRPSVEQALEGVSVARWREAAGALRAGGAAKCVSVLCVRSPVYLGGRYVKLSRTLPQSPWIVDGKRMMHSSVQEIIFEPIARMYELSSEDVEHRLKFLSAGREDVDVRCLGDGRPFAIEISDPRRELTADELREACEEVSRGARVLVQQMVYVTRDELTQLKKGEETKCKTYEALCVKLSRSDGGKPVPSPVTSQDIDNINTAVTPLTIEQRTPLRVAHRRALLARARDVLAVEAGSIPGHPCVFKLRVRTAAGTYVKEFVHGDLGRTKPSLKDIMAAGKHVSVDILALDVASVELDWPKIV